MKKTILLLALSVSTFCLLAQQPDSLLKQFKYRINQYRAINFSVGGGSQYNQADFATGTNKNRASSAGFNGGYYFTKSTDKIQLTETANLSGNFNHNKSSDQTSSNTSRSFFALPQYTISNKWFTKKKFTEFGAAVSGELTNNKSVIQSYPAAGINNQAAYTATVTLGIGKGRLENVTDMQNALWLYKELLKEQQLSGSLSATDLIELGKGITKGNNTRILDSRKKNQFLLSTVDQYLQQKALIKKTDINYFNSLNDILFYAYNNARFTGTEKFIRLSPSVTGLHNNQSQTNGIEKSTHIFNTQSVLLSTGFKKYTPTSLTHQTNYGVAVNLSYLNADNSDRFFTNGSITGELKGKTDIKKAGANIFYEHAVYPNTRTNINVGLQSDLGYQNIDNRNFYAVTNAYCNINYFINYHTRLTFGAGALFQKNTYTISNYLSMTANSFQLYTNAGLLISL